MIKFIIGAAGSGKSTAMIKIIDKLSDKKSAICIIVPEQFSYEFDKTLYKSIGAKKFNNLLSLSFTGLARHLFQLYGDSERYGEYADETSRMILIYQAITIAQSNPESNRFFQKQSNKQGFAEEILKLIEELKKSGITPQQLNDKSSLLDKKLKDKTRDIGFIYLEYERLMKKYNFKDNFDDINKAAEIANLNKYFVGKSVFIDEFESFTGDQINLIHVILSSAENVTITLRTDNVNAEEFTLFETVNCTYRTIIDICHKIKKEYKIMRCTEAYRFKNADIAYLSCNILRNHVSKEDDFIPEPENIKIIETKDFYDELEYVCASIKHLIYDDKSLKYSDIAVISNNIEEYTEVLEAAFYRYNIPYFLSIKKSVAHTSIMIFFSSLLDIIASKKYKTEIIFRHIKCGLINLSLTEISMLENYCYKWGIDGSLWNETFTAPDENLELINSIRTEIIEPIEKLKNEVQKKITTEKMCKLIYKHITECGVEKNISKTLNALIMENKYNEAAELKRLWSYLIDVLDSLSETLGKTEITINEVKRIINSLIERINYSLAPQTLDSVTAASARTARLNSPKIVFIMGANDGNFPNTVNTHGIFSESDKQKLAENGIDISRRLPELIASERLVVYKSLSAASEKIFITYSLSDLSGQSKYSASVIDSIIKLFRTHDILITDSQITPDYYAVTMKSAFFHYMQDIKSNNVAISSIRKLLLDDIDYRRRLSYVINRSEQIKKYNVSKSITERLKCFDPMRISPSGFELYNKCHFQYFCKECLKLFQREKIDLNVRYSGNIIHSCFCKIISSRSKEEFINLSYKKLQSEITQSADKYLEENMGGNFAKNPRFLLGFKKLSERLVRVFMHTQQELMASDFTPKSFEINLRNDDNVNDLKLSFSNGKKLSFGGIIDRADVCEIGDKKYLRIIDYKSSRREIDSFTLSNGINMQMLLYLFTITQKNGLFSDHIPAGILYSPVTISSIDTDDIKESTENTNLINSKLKTSGLVLSERSVLEAMEHDISGKYIPVKLNKKSEIDEKSSCLSSDGFLKLKEFTYEKLIRMAEEVYSGDADANPLVFSETDNPCIYCDYVNMCGNYPMTKYRDAYKTDTSEVDEILNMKAGEENVMD